MLRELAGEAGGVHDAVKDAGAGARPSRAAKGGREVEQVGAMAARSSSSIEGVTLLALDPGNAETAFVVYDRARRIPTGFGKIDNADMLAAVHGGLRNLCDRHTMLAIEMIASYGMPVGREVFETCVWIGRFIEAWSGPHKLVYRRDVKLELCGNQRAKDGNVRQALIDRWGGKDVAIGKKASPGPLYGFSADVWQALGVAVTCDVQTSARERSA
jgi:hypothetical protein